MILAAVLNRRELALPEVPVESAAREQLLVRSLLDYVPVPHDEDEIGAAYC